jgi:hypothetical protein
MAGNEWARYCLGCMEYNSWQVEGKYGNLERAVKHLTIAASAGVSFNEYLANRI